MKKEKKKLLCFGFSGSFPTPHQRKGKVKIYGGASSHTEFCFYFGQNIGALALLPPLVPSALDLIEWQTEDALFSGAAS